MKSFKAIAVFAAILALSLASCAKKDGGATASSTGGAAKSTKQKEISIYLVTMDSMDRHWIKINDQAQATAKEIGGVKVTWMSPSAKDDAQQIECVNNAVAAGADVIIIAPNGPDAIVAPLKEAASQGVKIIYVDTPGNYPAEMTVATDNTAGGKVAGEALLQALTDKGVTSGKIGIVSVNAATTSTAQREDGFRSAFEGTDFELLPAQYCDGDAGKSKDVSTNFINQDVVALYGCNEGCTTGIGNAIAELGETDILGIGFDNSDAITQQVKKGYLIGNVVQNPKVMGEETVRGAVKVMRGEPIEKKFIDTGVQLQTKDNIVQ